MVGSGTDLPKTVEVAMATSREIEQLTSLKVACSFAACCMLHMYQEKQDGNESFSWNIEQRLPKAVMLLRLE